MITEFRRNGGGGRTVWNSEGKGGLSILEFPKARGGLDKEAARGRVWIFSGITHYSAYIVSFLAVLPHFVGSNKLKIAILLLSLVTSKAEVAGHACQLPAGNNGLECDNAGKVVFLTSEHYKQQLIIHVSATIMKYNNYFSENFNVIGSLL